MLGEEVGAEFLGLLDAVAGQGWVGGYAGWGADVAAVFAGLRVDDPVGAELELLILGSVGRFLKLWREV